MPPRVIALCALLLACSGDPMAEAAGTYTLQLEPLLVSNQQLSQDYLDVAGLIKAGEIETKAVVLRLEKEILPAAQLLHTQAEAIASEEAEVAKVHGQLVEAWGKRVICYEAILEAYKADDLQTFDQATKENLLAKLEEERYFQSINGLFEPYGVRLNPFPH